MLQAGIVGEPEVIVGAEIEAARNVESAKLRMLAKRAQIRRRCERAESLQADYRWKLAFGSGTLHGPHAEIVEKRFDPCRRGIRRGEKFFAGENGIGAGKEAERDGFARQRVASAGEPDARSGHQDSRGGDGADHHQGIELWRICERSAFHAGQHVDGNAFRMRVKNRKLMQQADAILFGLADSENSAAADGDSRIANARDGAQAIFVNARGDDAAVKFGRGIEIVIVGGEAGLLQASGLMFR